jgi:O-antigen/teichoic acid export membrane protein
VAALESIPVDVSVADERRILRDRFVRSTANVLALKVGFVCSSFLLSVVLARLLGATAYGAYTYAFAWVVLLGVPAMLGMDQLMVREVAACQHKEDWGALRGLFSKANQAVLMVSLGIVVLGAVSSWIIFRHLESPALLTFWLALLRLPLITLTRLRQSALQGLHRVAVGLLPESLIQPLLLLSLIAAAHSIAKSELTALSAMALNLAATAVAFAVGVWMLWSLLPRAAQLAKPVVRTFSWTTSILPLMFLASVGVLFGQVDTLIVGTIKGARAVGVYGVADRGAEAIGFVLIAAASVFAPMVSKMYAAGEMAKLQRMLTKFSRITLLLSLPAALALIFFGKLFLSFFYGPQFVEGRQALAILSIGQVFSVAAGPVGMILIMTGHEADAATAIGLATVTNIVLNLAMVPRWGLEGAAIANAASIVLANLLMMIWLWRSAGLQSWALGTVHLLKKLRPSE